MAWNLYHIKAIKHGISPFELEIPKHSLDLNPELKSGNLSGGGEFEFPEQHLRKSGDIYEKVTDDGIAEGITVEDSGSHENITGEIPEGSQITLSSNKDEIILIIKPPWLKVQVIGRWQKDW